MFENIFHFLLISRHSQGKQVQSNFKRVQTCFNLVW